VTRKVYLTLKTTSELKSTVFGKEFQHKAYILVFVSSIFEECAICGELNFSEEDTVCEKTNFRGSVQYYMQQFNSDKNPWAASAEWQGEGQLPPPYALLPRLPPVVVRKNICALSTLPVHCRSVNLM